MKTKSLTTLVLAALLALPCAFGASFSITAKIPFPFVASGRTLPAGEYEFTLVKDLQTAQVSALGEHLSVFVPVVCRLAITHPSTNSDAHVVFDKVGEVYTLSELWEPGVDGVLVETTKTPHEHHVVHVPR